MGLDMYLTASRFIWFNEEQPSLPDFVPATAKIKSIECEAIYWRKANAIHQWFVDIVQNGEDECRPHYVSRGDLEQLRDTCQKVLDDPERGPELLPTRSRLVGGTDYGEGYLDDLRHTVNEIDLALATFPDKHWDFEYRSSW